MANRSNSMPTPPISKGKSPSFNTDKTGGTDKSRQSHTKTPQTPMPTPTIAHNEPPHAVVPGSVKKPITHTSMPRPNAKATSGKSKKEGGGGY